MLRKLLLTLAVVVGFTFALKAQVGQGTIIGTITDEAGEPIPFANVTLMSGSNQILGTTTDFDGKFNLKPIPPGTYDLQVSYVGYQTKRIAGITASSDRITKQDVSITEGVALQEVEIVSYSKPLIELDNTTTGETKTREEIGRMAVRSAADIAKTAGGGVVSSDDGSGAINVRGSRSSNNITYIDGIKVIGSSSLPKSAIEEVTVQTGGLSAQYGDVTGGITSITTRGGLKNYFGSVEVLSSGFKASEGNVVGLDNFGYNLVGFSAGGPIIANKNEEGEVIDAPLSFLVSGEYRHSLNPRPSAVQLYKPKDEIEQEIRNNPLFTDGVNTGVYKRAETLLSNDFEKIDYQRNVASQSVVLNGKLDYTINDISSLSFGGSYNISDGNSDVRDFQLYNYGNNPYASSVEYRVYGRYTHRFKNAAVEDGKEDNSLVKNAFFSLQVDYSKSKSTTEDERHKDDFFRYGHIGKFEAVTEPSYSQKQGTVELDGVFYQNPYELVTFDRPIAYNYTPGNTNPTLANYTSNFYRYRDQFPEIYTTRELVEGFGGLINGSSIQGNIYNLWSAPGTPYNGYSKGENDQYRVSGRGSADIGGHAITLGFEYEQRVQRSYGLNPMALWQLGRGTVNSHIEQLDKSNYTVEWDGSYPTITYERLNSGDPTYFAVNMRKAMGLDPYGSDFIDFDNHDIDLYKMKYFAPDQLINPANGVGMSYVGFDHLGNKVNGNPSLDDFFNEEKTDAGRTFKSRPLAAYQPIYIAGYLEDKFAFEDLVFRVGVRLDRFDANQPVLKDPFSFMPTQDAAYAKNRGASVPSNIGDDYVVYVSEIDNPNKDNIVGYRDPSTQTFYNSSGAEINDPSVLESGSVIAPWLRDPSKRTLSRDMSTESFEDYDPQYTLMPRISFSFPISDEATFFANYDILTQRPSNVALNPIDIIYIQSHNRILSNPSLKPTKTITYELGFKQKISNNSALSLATFYREQRDEIQVVRHVGAFPGDYLTYSNQDFGTVKGFTFNYDMRRIKNIMLRVNYTLQFAEGTGSGSLSSLNLVNSGQPNLRTIFPYNFDRRHQITATLDYRYGSGKAYNGPKIAGKNILEDAGLNLQFIGSSGSPYTARSSANNSENMGGGQYQATVIGDVNGSRLPWTLRVDARLDKSFLLKWGDDTEENQKQWKNGKKTSMLTVYLQVLNLLDNKNIRSVYAYTGNADDDGYLTSAKFQDQIRSQFSEQSFRDQYSIRLQNMYNYELPRRIRLGVSLTF